MKVNSGRMRFADMESITGQTVNFTKETGRKTKCMVLVLFLGKTASNIMVNSSTIKEKVKVLSPGAMAENILASGKQENNMEEELISARKASKRWANGKMDSRSDG